MGKTAVFVISTLQMLKEDAENKDIQVLVIAHTKELAYQIQNEYKRFTHFMPNVKTEVFFGGRNINQIEKPCRSIPQLWWEHLVVCWI